jgi:hypothetical protein
VACKKSKTKNFAQTPLLEVSDLNIDWDLLKSIGFQILQQHTATSPPKKKHKHISQHYSTVTLFTVMINVRV